MLLIKGEVLLSKIHGLGLFATEPISKGSRIWQFSKLLDQEISEEIFSKLSLAEQEYILFYGFLSKKTGKYHLSFDNVKFINHAENGNVGIDISEQEEVEYPLIATADIKLGEELLQNYNEFENARHEI